MSWHTEFIDETKYTSHFDILDNNDNLICSYIKGEDEADLIAAAPKMLKTLEEIYDVAIQHVHLEDSDKSEIIYLCDEAIKKAKGE